MRTLKRGCTGNDVRYLQTFLPGCAVDGSFGPGTEKAVKAKQKALGLKVDGSVGPATQKAMGLSDFIVKVYDLNKYEVWFCGTPYAAKYKPLYTLANWATQEKADEVFNLAFFNSKGTGSDNYGVIKGRTLTYVKGKGKDIGYGGTEERITINSDNVCAGYKLGMKNGVIKHASLVGSRARNANGMLADGRYFHVQSVTKATEHALCAYMKKNYAVSLLLIQDSGGSTGYYNAKTGVLLAAEKEGSAGRPVATAVCVRRK